MVMMRLRMKLAVFVALVCLGASPACAANLLTATITTAVTAATTTPLQFLNGAPRNLEIQGTFTYGSGGTSVDAYVQTSLDSGNTWIDIAEFHFTTASERYVFNLSSLTPVTSEYTPTDGALSANTAKDGIIGSKLRVEYTTVGTYAAGTTLSIDVQSRSPVLP
jgi:hypothetical protein